MAADFARIVAAVLADYALPWNGIHGVSHWARVYENGLFLARKTGANLEVVRLFALFHDARRVNEWDDRDHGLRGAEFARTLHGRLFELSEPEFQLLHRACAGHTDELTHPDPTIQTCWDSDRLDLGRVGIKPHPSRLCTEAARKPETIRWADSRSTFGDTPAFIRHEWKVDLGALSARD